MFNNLAASRPTLQRCRKLYKRTRPVKFNFVQSPDERPPREDPLAVHCSCVCSGSVLLGDLLGVSRSRERDFLSVLSIYPVLCLLSSYDRRLTRGSLIVAGVSTKPRPKSVYDFLGLLYSFIVQLNVRLVRRPT